MPHTYLTCMCTGEMCETNINECASNPCVHGECTDQVGDYQCHCQLPFTGKNCETEMNPCAPSPCMNNAQCVPTNSYQDFKCSCPAGFAGGCSMIKYSVFHSICVLMFMYYALCCFTGLFYPVVRQISMLFRDSKDSVCWLCWSVSVCGRVCLSFPICGCFYLSVAASWVKRGEKNTPRFNVLVEWAGRLE